MATRKRPQLGALFGGDGPATDRSSGATRLRAVTDEPAGTDGRPDAGASGQPPAGVREAPRILVDAGVPSAAGGDRVRPGSPWSAGGWLDPLAVAAQYFDFWQSVLDTSRRVVLAATATAIGRPRPDQD